MATTAIIASFGWHLPSQVLLHRFGQYVKPHLSEDLVNAGEIDAPYFVGSFLHFRASSSAAARQVAAAARSAGVVIKEGGTEARICATMKQKTKEQKDRTCHLIKLGEKIQSFFTGSQAETYRAVCLQALWNHRQRQERLPPHAGQRGRREARGLAWRVVPHRRREYQEEHRRHVEGAHRGERQEPMMGKKADCADHNIPTRIIERSEEACTRIGKAPRCLGGDHPMGYVQPARDLDDKQRFFIRQSLRDRRWSGSSAPDVHHCSSVGKVLCHGRGGSRSVGKKHQACDVRVPLFVHPPSRLDPDKQQHDICASEKLPQAAPREQRRRGLRTSCSGAGRPSRTSSSESLMSGVDTNIEIDETWAHPQAVR